MKMSNETFALLTEGVSANDTETVRDAYRNGRFPRADKVKDLNMRYRWDLLWASPNKDEIMAAVGSEDLLSSHIDTALRAAVPALEVK